MKRTLRFVVVGMLASLLMGTGVTAAQAGTGYCALGSACAWKDASYEGGLHRTEINISLYWDVWFNDVTTSVAANGRSCNYTRFYADTYLTVRGNDAGSGNWFTLYSKTRMGQNYQDPNLTNGAGFDGTGTDWNDKVSAITFTGCR